MRKLVELWAELWTEVVVPVECVGANISLIDARIDDR